MSEPFIAEIKIFAGDFAPRSWAFCDGQLLPVSQNTALFSIVGTEYGGDGRTTLALPNLQGRTAMHPGRGPGLISRRLGELDGAESITLNPAEMPAHNHSLQGTDAASDSGTPANTSAFSKPTGVRIYGETSSSASLVPLNSSTASYVGQSTPHENMQPYIAMNFIIALQGLYPSRG